MKHDGKRFDEDRVNLVFVGSGFESLSDWRNQVPVSYSAFEDYNMFSATNDKFNVFYVDSLNQSFCDLGCYNIDRLLCCETYTAQTIASKCFPYGNERLQTMVIHNDETYGGAGYAYANVATATINFLANLVLIHELGHSLFELDDEYPNGGVISSANCDVAGCNKWSDLINAPTITAQYGAIGCSIPACLGDAYFVGQVSFMEYLGSPVGAVNERLSCCTYRALTNGFPSYCEIFNFSNGYLDNFCDLDYQEYDSKYRSVEDPIVVTISLDRDGPTVRSEVKASSGKFRAGKVQGNSDKTTISDGQVLVKAKYDDGTEKTLVFSLFSFIHVPPATEATKQSDDQSHVVTNNDALQAVFENGSMITHVLAKYSFGDESHNIFWN